MNRDPYPPDWRKRRSLIIKQYDRECQSCGETVPPDSDTELHAHHIQPIKEGGGHEMENLLPLCGPCHRRIHATRSDSRLTPRDRYDCAFCDGSYIEGSGEGGSFCSRRCQLNHKAEKMLRGLSDDSTICSTCFADFPRRATVCPNCDNWDPDQNNRERLDASVDVTSLLREVIRRYD